MTVPPEVSAPSSRREDPAQSRRLRDAATGWASGPRFVVGVLVLYGLARAVSAGLLLLLTRYQMPVGWTGPDVEYLTIVGLWDAGWYRQIAEHGYPAVMPTDASGQLQQNPWAFYPLFPFAAKAVMEVTGWSFAAAGSTLALVLGACAAVVIALQLRERVGPRVALAAVVVWATCASSPVLQVAYSESLAILLLALVLWALQREAWWAAAALAFSTGLARPIAVPLGIVALVAVAVRLRARRIRPVRRSEGIGMLGALLACGAAGLTWPVIVWIGTGVPSAYTDTMATWRAEQHIVPLAPWVGISRYLFGPVLGPLALVAIVVLLIAVVAGPWASRLGPVLRAWCLAYPFYLALVLDPGTSVFRYLLPLYPWAVIAVDGAWRTRRRIPAVSTRPLDAGPPGEQTLGEGPERPESPPRADAPIDRPDALEPRPSHLWGLAALWVVVGLATQWWWLYELWRFVPPSDFPP